jgi:hypothetical protein
MFDHRLDLRTSDKKRSKHVVRKAGLLKDALDRQGASWHVRRVLQDADVSGHQGWRGEAEHLPQREVPRHDGEDDTERFEDGVRFGAFGGDDVWCEVRLGVVRIVIADPRALLDLGMALRQRLAHLLGHQPCEIAILLSQHDGRLLHQRGPCAERCVPPQSPCFVRPGDGCRGMFGRHVLVGLHRLAGRRIHGCEAHGIPD